MIIRHKYTEIRIAIATYDAPGGGDTYRATVFTRVQFTEVDQFSDSARGERGFGSSGV